MTITKTQAIKNFLTSFTKLDLAKLYHYSMEAQVNVAQDNGEQITGEYQGRMWRGFTDGVVTWKSFRIPYNAATNPEYTDTNLNWSLKDHAEGIGMTGWDWVNKVSKWVAFDFDSIIGHSDGLTAEQLHDVTEAAKTIPWVTARKSTSGKGLHLYVFVDNVPTNNHNEHAALARAIIGKMAATVNFDFQNHVDICGGNVWVWHRKMVGTDGLELIKQGEILTDIPLNWRDHVPVIKGKRRKIIPSGIKEQSLFDKLTGQYNHVKLDEQHQILLDYLEQNQASWWFDQDNNLLVCHTFDLKQAHTDLNLRGIFETISTGKDRPDHNVFGRPCEHPNGSWIFRRFTPGVQEVNTWFQDASGWTTCYYNREPSLDVAAKVHDGIESEKGEYFFNEAETAATAATALGASIKVPNWASVRQSTIKPHKDGKRIIISIKKEQNDNPIDMAGWKEEKGWWKRIYGANLPSDNTETQNYDNIIRHLITVENQDAGWVLNANGNWQNEPLYHLKIAMKSLGLNDFEISNALGKCVIESWKLVNKPFQPEYPGDREWNKSAVQLRYLPQQSEPFVHRTWDKLLNHCGQGLDEDVKKDSWCVTNGVITGADYLRLWIASLFQYPLKHLPYLFLYSPEQQTGKTTLHEALKLLITPNGYMDVKAALVNPQGFNEEMKSAIICAVDECDLRQNKQAYNRIKDWDTADSILIHPKGKTPYLVQNISHFIHTGNDPNECQVFTYDKRIVVIRVPILNDIIPKDDFFKLLNKEAAAFLGTLFKIEIPTCKDRLGIPVISSEEKEISAKLTRNALEVFIDECCFYSPGDTVKYSDFWIRFNEWLDPNDLTAWTKIKVGRSLPSANPKGRLISDGAQFHIANLSFEKPIELKKVKYVLKQDRLQLVEHKE